MADRVEAMTRLLDRWGTAPPPSDLRWQPIRCVSPDHDDSHASARIHMAEGAYVCMACGLKAGSPLRLLMAVEGIGYREALDIVGRERADDEPQSSGPKRPWKAHRKGGATWRLQRSMT